MVWVQVRIMPGRLIDAPVYALRDISATISTRCRPAVSHAPHSPDQTVTRGDLARRRRRWARLGAARGHLERGRLRPGLGPRVRRPRCSDDSDEGEGADCRSCDQPPVGSRPSSSRKAGMGVHPLVQGNPHAGTWTSHFCRVGSRSARRPARLVRPAVTGMCASFNSERSAPSGVTATACPTAERP